MNDFKLPIFNRFYQLIKFLYKITHNMPREYKYNLGEEIIDLSWLCLDGAFKAGYIKGSEKGKEIEKISYNFDCLKLRLRMASEIGAISDNVYVHLQENYIIEIGKMIGGWKKWDEEKE